MEGGTSVLGIGMGEICSAKNENLTGIWYF